MNTFKKFYKFILTLACVALIGIHLTDSALAAETMTYYEFQPVATLALTDDYGVMPLSATSWDTSDQRMLSDIRNALCYSTTIGDGSILGWIQEIADNMPDMATIQTQLRDMVSDLDTIRQQTSNVNTYISNLDYLDQIYTELDGIADDTSYLASVVSYLCTIDTNVGYINTNVGGIYRILDGFITDMYSRRFTWSTFDVDSTGNIVESGSQSTVVWNIIGQSFSNLTNDGYLHMTGDRTLYSRVKQLQEVLASDDDLALANSQKANREEIESSFLGGSSGSTSLGASDFGALSDIGGTVKDTISLNGQSSIGSFTDGLAGADTAGQGWFSESTRAALDSVPVTYDRSNPDPYNMSGWQERYAWLEGE